ncbi:hypothetical protein GB864_10665, partial [Agromyces sp. MMS17-SY077]|nr:hypothetical protein [Agromyces seonyuensis]
GGSRSGASGGRGDARGGSDARGDRRAPGPRSSGPASNGPPLDEYPPDDGYPGSGPSEPERPFSITDLPRDPATRLERDGLQAILQYPQFVDPALLRKALESRFGQPSLAVVRDGIASALADGGGAVTVEAVIADVPESFRGLVQQLVVAPVPQRNESELPGYVSGIVGSLVDRELLRRKQELLGALQRADPADADGFTALQRSLVDLERERRALRGV